jgi:putative ABC transport system permease protein
LGVRARQVDFGDCSVLLEAVDAQAFHAVNQGRGPLPGFDLYPRLSEGGAANVIVSENFAALHHVRDGDMIELRGPRGPVKLRIIGTMADYTWNLGKVVIDRNRYKSYFQDPLVDMFEIYLKPGADAAVVRDDIMRRWGAEHALVVLTREELLTRIKSLVNNLCGIAYSQEIIVALVAALGVVTALLISVLQRRRELGILRAIGATRAQVIRSILAEATIMGAIGTLIGLLLGVPLEWYIVHIILFEEVGFMFPVSIPWLEASLIAAFALTIATLAGLGPALHTLRLRIPEAIAYE